MKTYLRTRRVVRGFTLIELIVVLMIVVGLAAVLIPAVTEMVSRTNASTSSGNISEVANCIQRYETQYMTYPNNFDSLKLDLTGTDLDTLDASLNAVTTDVTLTANLRAPLTEAGITRLGVHATGDATFTLPTSTAITNTTVLQGLTTAAQQALGLETTGVADKYVVFGIGALSDMNGKTMMDAPVYFPKQGSLNPTTTYSRFMAVFQITDGTDPLRRARLVAVIAPTGAGLSDTLSDYFATVTNN